MRRTFLGLLLTTLAPGLAQPPDSASPLEIVVLAAWGNQTHIGRHRSSPVWWFPSQNLPPSDVNVP
jgi:hypothetical protein